MSSIDIAGLTRVFKGSTAVNAVDLRIDDGEFCVLLGPSGCGKTTLLRMIAGLLEPTSGTIELDGADITDVPSKKRDIAMVFQSYALYPHLSVEKNLRFPLTQARKVDGTRLSGDEMAERVNQVAASLEIDMLLDRLPKQLSGGQRQRVALGRALVRNPKAFLMDEPLSNLDASLRTQTRQELTSLHRRLGATFVYVTHDQVEAMTMATKIVVINKGIIEQVGSPLEVYDRPASTFVAKFIGSPPMNLIPATVTSVAGTVRVEGDGFAADLWAGTTAEIDVLLGVRPEHIRVLDHHDPTAALRLPLLVSNVEQLGNETIVYGRVADSDICIRGERRNDLRPGDAIEIGLELVHAHLFDSASGRRLEWVADDPAASKRARSVEPDQRQVVGVF
ncbi:ABC transporter ATP-binding protein [Dietzia maris]|uniref:ABC transporter ATP-binding protein n=1 Tax=Dietzia TaxID=37914 RepID=UPI0007C7B4F4|nr:MULTISPECIES: ABC transporter ATP-binding protein [unclassified Dietzia]MBB1019540.1 ABC transporter ATP-binding protein [Dietzia sp. DQ11-71]MBB1052594.1 ABC transporter ATP-binding protein [Dietzia sp. CW19]OAH62003.1 ABC transporter [Dietzia cinnamea]